MINDPLNPMPIYPERKNDNLKKCHYSTSSYFVVHLYPSILILISTVFAIKTRKLPENFNETKSIGYAMYSTCILWLLSIPLYFGVQYEDPHTKAHLYAIVATMRGLIVLICIFMPKVYIILLKPHKNIDEQQVRMTKLRADNYTAISSTFRTVTDHT